MKVRSNLKTIVDSKSLSIREIARDIDYRFESVRQLYNNEMERVPLELLTKLCAYLQVTPGEILILESE